MGGGNLIRPSSEWRGVSSAGGFNEKSARGREEAAVVFMHRALAAVTAHVPVRRISFVTADPSPEGPSSFGLGQSGQFRGRSALMEHEPLGHR